MITEINPCAFCGGHAVVTSGRICWVTCEKCDASGPVAYDDGQDEAIRLWNEAKPKSDPNWDVLDK